MLHDVLHVQHYIINYNEKICTPKLSDGIVQSTHNKTKRFLDYLRKKRKERKKI